MNISKIKEFIKDKPLWLKILVSVLTILIIGFSVWFGFDSCASISLDKLDVKTDKVNVNVDGVKIQPKDVSLCSSRDEVFSLCQYIESVSKNMISEDRELLLNNYGLNSATYTVLLNSYDLVVDNSIVFFSEDIL